MGDGDGTAAGDGAEGLGGSGGVGFAEPSNEGAALALLRHKATGTKLLACAIRPSVPDRHDRVYSRGCSSRSRSCSSAAAARRTARARPAAARPVAAAAGGGASSSVDDGTGGGADGRTAAAARRDRGRLQLGARHDRGRRVARRLPVHHRQQPHAARVGARVRAARREGAHVHVPRAELRPLRRLHHLHVARPGGALGVLDTPPVSFEELPATPDLSDHLSLSIGESAPDGAAPPECRESPVLWSSWL